jgi:hypothetical protein
MPQAAHNSALLDRHYITLIVRLTLDQAGDLIQGDLLDTTNGLPEHFIGRAGLYQAVDAWLQQQHSRNDQDVMAPTRST